MALTRVHLKRFVKKREIVLNAFHCFWLLQDRLLLLGIQSTIHGIIGLTIKNCQTLAKAWNKLAASYANRSITRMLTLLSSLIKTTKQSLSIAEYIAKIKILLMI